MGSHVSMNQTEELFDHATMNCYFAPLKSETMTGQFASQIEVSGTIFEYLVGWYNRQSLHSSLDYHNTAEFEALFGR
jgi:transposase InsO family protein